MDTKPKTRNQLSRELAEALFADDDDKIAALIAALQETYPTLVVRNDVSTTITSSERSGVPTAQEISEPIDPDSPSPGGTS